MPVLQWSDSFGRKARCGPVPDLAVPTWDLLEAAIKAGKHEEALELLQYARLESKLNFDSKIVMINFILKFVGDNFGDEAVEKIYRENLGPRIAQWVEAHTSPEGNVARVTESHRGHSGRFTIIEEKDRFAVINDPCGSGQQMRRSVAPEAIAVTKKPHPWSYGLAGVPYYCAHCCIILEVLPIEMQGYPTAVIEFNHDPKAPCVQYFYKKPELVPEKYFTRVGRKRDPASFKKRQA